MKLYESSNLHGASCLHALTEQEAVSLRNLGLTNPIAIIPNSVDLPTTGMICRPSCDNERKVLLYFGRIHPKKGILESLEAWCIALRSDPDLATKWVFEIAGWGDAEYERFLRQKSIELGIQRHVRFVGPKFGNEKASSFMSASALILASYSEGLPMVVLEAWASGLPVFMTKECNLTEAFGCGAAIEIRMPVESMARTIGAHLRAKDLEKFGAKGRDLVEKRFSGGVPETNHILVYEWLLKKARRPDFVFE